MAPRRRKPKYLYATIAGKYVSIDEPAQVIAVEPLDDLHVLLTFHNGKQRVRDLGPYFRGGIFDDIRRNPDIFRAVRVDPESRTIVWPNGADLCPDVLFYNLKSAWMPDSDPIEVV